MGKQETIQSLLRPPIVAVLGHVDHGKTSLLDAIRKTSVTAGEAGGITQSIGSSLVTTKDGKKITFIDTPGHAAFSKMRLRGASVADIVVLVVAADDGPKPQTLEALDHIRAAKVPMIVAFTKIDLPSASVEAAQGALEAKEVFFEGRGGDIPSINISSRTGEGIDELLDLINLMAEVNEIKGDPSSLLEAVVVETTKDKRGQMVSVVVRNGKISIGDEIVTDGVRARVRGIFDENSKNLPYLEPGFGGQILGFTDSPAVGASVEKFDPNKNYSESSSRAKIKEVGKDELGIFLKTKTLGSMEALTASLPQKVVVVGSSIGDVNESDVLFAKSSGTGIYAFEAKTPSNVARLADMEGVKIETYNIIYELIESLEKRLKKDEIIVNGKAQVIAIFPYENKKVAGSKILAGVMKRGDKLAVMRNEVKLGDARVVSLRKMKNEVSEAKAGEELGILFEPQLDFTVGDMLLSIG